MSVASVYQLPLFAPDKRCPACDTSKPLDAFPVCKRSSSGVASYCKACKNAKWHAAHPQDASARLQERWSIRRLREEGFKRCPRCHDVKPLDSFGPRSERPGQYSSRCKMCEAESARAAYPTTPKGERNRIKHGLLAQGLRRCTKCGEVKELRLFFTDPRNTTGTVSRCKECYSAAVSAYVLKHADRLRAWRAWYSANRRAVLERHAEGSFTRADIVALHAEQDGLCAYCQKPLDIFDVDHKQPLSRHGSNGRSNLCLACPVCNLRKGARTEHEFRALLASGYYDGVSGRVSRLRRIRRVQ